MSETRRSQITRTWRFPCLSGAVCEGSGLLGTGNAFRLMMRAAALGEVHTAVPFPSVDHRGFDEARADANMMQQRGPASFASRMYARTYPLTNVNVAGGRRPFNPSASRSAFVKPSPLLRAGVFIVV